MISEIERSISGFITRLHAVSGKFALMTDHSEVIDAALPLFSKINKLVSILELLPEAMLDEAESVCVSNVVSTKTLAAIVETPPKPKCRRGRKRKATDETSTNLATEEHITELDISSEQLTTIIKTEPESYGVDIETISVDERDLKVDKEDPEDDGAYGIYDDDFGNDDERRNDEDARNDEETRNDDEAINDGEARNDDEVDEVILNDVSKSDLEGKTLSETLKLLKFPKSEKNKKACSICGRLMSTLASLIQHERLHRSDFRYNCKICNKGFMDMARHRSHELGHQQQKQFKCDLCDKEYCHSKDLRAHMATHLRIREECSICHKLVAKSSFFKHKMACSGKKFRCTMCPYTAGYKCNFNRHMQRLHPENIPGKVNLQQLEYKCDLCEIGFSFKTDLQNHIVLHHQIHEECDICNRTFCKSTIKKHKLGCGIKLQCNFCPFTVGYKSSLARHIRTKHKSKPVTDVINTD